MLPRGILAGALLATLPADAATTNSSGAAMLVAIKPALAIGNRIIEQAKTDKVTVDVSVNRNPLFFHTMAGTSPNNVDWIRRKSNLVNRTGHAAFFMHVEAVSNGQDFNNLPTFDTKDFATHGGSFPIILKSTGQIGTITVSGLEGADDHAMAVRALKWCLKQDNFPLN